MSWYDKYVRITHDEKYRDLLREDYIYARKHSNDISTHTAAILVNDKFKRLVIASNSFPKGTKEISGWDQKPKKDAISNHAERAVIYEAAKKVLQQKGLQWLCPGYLVFLVLIQLFILE